MSVQVPNEKIIKADEKCVAGEFFGALEGAQSHGSEILWERDDARSDEVRERRREKRDTKRLRTWE